MDEATINLTVAQHATTLVQMTVAQNASVRSPEKAREQWGEWFKTIKAAITTKE